MGKILINEEIDKKTDEFIKKATRSNFSSDTLFICGVLTFCKQNKGKEIELLDKFIELIDKYPDEREFVAKACTAAGVD